MSRALALFSMHAPMAFRVSQEFPLKGDPPTQAATDRLHERFTAVAPDAGALIELGVGRMLVTMTFDALDAASAAEMAATAARAVLVHSAVRVDVSRVGV